eukprot:CAMPEP_0114255326 /NCGR_PEP_ID=MMETSP0058-20121206/17491_1 /TAXON_ID=36894 /ORGANISM="Pyramimonas parkeae, CCMP726" /LENGTH=337 /DNA_ID=CAMNT_0001369681 /DNA_START=132 /DNA_END=1145 /DNA_ORIENTATION=-
MRLGVPAAARAAWPQVLKSQRYVGARRSVVVGAAKKSAKEADEDDEYEEIEVEEEVEEEVMEEVGAGAVRRPVQGTVASVQTALPQLWEKPVVRNAALAAATLLVGTLLWSVFQVVKKATSKRGKRKRVVGKNMLAVEAINAYLPDRRAEFAGAVGGIRRATGFSQELLFRKYLRYLLDQRLFDGDAVADVVALKTGCRLTDEQVVAMMEESAKRTFERTGILMRKPGGMTAAGLQKKATGRALFAKLMYLADQDALLPGELGGPLQTKMMEIFGATEEDFRELRIASLEAEDIDRLEALMGRGEAGGVDDDTDDDEDEADGEGSKELPEDDPPKEK